jgi:prepilin-type processing-associated H-X9-DG protein
MFGMGETNPNAEVTAANENTRGAFAYHLLYPRTLGAVADGLSNTIAISEHTVGIVGNKAFANVGIVTDPDSATGANNTVANFNTATLLMCAPGGKYPATFSVDSGIGLRWSDAKPTYNGISTILPPNSPSARQSGDATRTLITPSSYHPGGVNASRLDGSVSFVSNTIDCGRVTDTTVRAVQSGTSPFGVWGALGSIDGGESTN